VPKQLLKVMKLMIFFLTVVCLHVSAAGYGQNGTVTISGKDLPLEKVFSVIKKQTDYVCFYGSLNLKDAKPVSLSFKNADVQEVLKAALWGQGLDFSITGKTITIMKKPVTAAASTAGPGRTVKAVGVVYNEVGQPLSGANVTIKATGKGTITNAKGEFELPAVPEGSPLVISFIGYAPQVVKVSEGKEMQVYLNVAKNELDKVVVQAYGTTTQRLATGNIATVTAAEIERQPIMNPLQALQGKVPGLVVSQTSGFASAPFMVELRGRSVINQDFASSPLYIVDGVPLKILDLGPVASDNYQSYSTGIIQNGQGGPANGQSPFFNINPSDIESITVLKDGDATAIYGSRGADGVIIITTKKGKAGKAKLEINAYHGVNAVTRNYKMLNTQQYLKLRGEAFYNDSIAYGIVPDAGSAPDLLVWDTTRYTDWQKFIYGKIGITTDAELNASGGDKFNNFRISGGYHDEKGILAYSGADRRGSVQFNLSHKSLDQKLNVSFTNFYSIAESNLISVNQGATLPPDAPAVFTPDGQLNWKGWEAASYVFQFGNLFDTYKSNTIYLNSALSIKYDLLKGLSFLTDMGYSTMKNSQFGTNPIVAQDPLTNPKGTSFFGNNNNNTWTIEPQLQYTTTFSKMKVQALWGSSIQHISTNYNATAGIGYSNDNLLGSISNAPTKNASDGAGNYKYGAMFGRVTLNWDDKYVVNVSARRDGSSRFGAGKQFGNFGAIGSAWIFTEENFFKDHLKFLSYGKIRMSYGLTGSDNIGDYGYLTRWTGSTTSIVPYQNQTSYAPTQHANPDLQWQVDRKLEGGLALGFLKDRIYLELTWYRNRCGNQLISYAIPGITGFTSILANSLASLQNSGFEGILKATIIDSKNVKWNANFNIGVNRNKLLAYPGLDQSPYANRYIIGQPMNLTYLLHFTGVDPADGRYTFEDKNKDGQILAGPGPKGDLYPRDQSIKFDGGFGTDLIYKGWSLNLFFHFRRLDYAKSAIFSGTFPGGFGNQSVQILDHWQKPGDIKPFSRLTTVGDNTDVNFASSDGTFSNGSFIRLQNVSLSYELPAKVLKLVGMQNARIYVRGENIFLITKYNGIDPEVPYFGYLPPAKIITGGIQFNF
jgi:TonB-linked SusC/RagA family outer membrane protein